MADDSLYFSRKGDLEEPGLHALLVGVSEYLHLPPPPNVDPQYRMARLASPALSAWVLAQRLTQLAGDIRVRLHRPLKTLRLLVSPNQKEVDSDLGGADFAAWAAKAPATRRTIQHALYAWREDARESRDAMTLFYIGGHGLRHSGNDALMLASDFRTPFWTDLDRALQFSSIRNGMAPTADFPDIAQTQFYFIDGCRNHNKQLDKIDEPRAARLVFQDKLNEIDYRAIPTYFASLDGAAAVGSAGRPTYFCKALLDGLEVGASENEPEGWPVTADGLKSAFERYRERNGDLNPVQMDSQVGNATLCWLKAPPLITLQLKLPAGIASSATVSFTDPRTGRLIVSQRNTKGMHEVILPTGMYDVQIEPMDGRQPLKLGTNRLSISQRNPWQLLV